MPDVLPTACIALPLDDHLNEKVEAHCKASRIDLRAPRDQLLAALAKAEGVLLSNMVRVNAEFFDAAPSLRVVAGVGVGYNNFDVGEASKRGVAICNTPDVLTAAVADLTVAFVLSLAKRLFENEAHARSGAWAARKPLPPLGSDITGKTLGVIGFGRIGKEVTRRLKVFGMRTTFNDVFTKPPPGAPESTYRSLYDLLRESDIVSLHTDLNPTSHHLIGERELSLMKPSAYLINTSRGPVIDQPALTAALQNEAIAGAALDVLEKEPPDPEDPIIGLPNVLTFPHMATATTGTRLAMRELAVENLLAVLEGTTPPACVNPEVLAKG
ncbi:MAG: D-glycerate dehydrogenase [Myxococcota bacterium]